MRDYTKLKRVTNREMVNQVIDLFNERREKIENAIEVLAADHPRRYENTRRLVDALPIGSKINLFNHLSIELMKELAETLKDTN